MALDRNQRKAAEQIKYAIIEIVFGYENSVTDGAMEEKDLPTVEQLQDEIYDGIMNNTYGDGTLSFHPQNEIKFCTREWLMAQIEKQLAKFMAEDAEYTYRHDTIKAGDRIYTPRFCTVTIKKVLTKGQAQAQGFNAPTHYKDDPAYDILGKSIDINHMEFVAVRK